MDMRRRDRRVIDTERIKQILESCSVCRIALRDEEGLYIVPLNFGYEYSGSALTLYFHSAKDGRKIRAIAADSSVAFELDSMGDIARGASLCSFSCNFVSITGAGNASIVTDTEEKRHALSLIVKHTAGVDAQFNEEQANTVAVIRLDAIEFSTKERK